MTGTSGFKGSGITDPFLTPDAPTDISVSGGIGSASVSFTAPTDTGGGAITQYVVSAKAADGTSTGTTTTSTSADVTLSSGTYSFAVQAFNAYGAGQFSGYSGSGDVFSSLSLYSVGDNLYGQLGTGDRVDASSPVQVGSAEWLQVYTNGAHSFGVKTDNTLYSWGRDYNGNGGLNTNEVARSSPTQVGALTNWLQVKTNGFTAYAIKTDGTLWAWGSNNVGQVGDSSRVNKSSPVQIGSDTDWVDVQPSGGFGNGTAIAIKSDGTIWTWGENGVGQLGIGLTGATDRSSPVQVGSETYWTAIAGSGGSQNATNFCMALTSSGEVYAWGEGSSKQLGTDSTADLSSPVQIASLSNVTKIACGTLNGYAITANNELFAWGEASAGAVGNNTSGVDVGVPTQIGALTSWREISGTQDQAAAIRTDGTLWTWGYGLHNLGVNLSTPPNTSSPVQVGSDTDWYSVNINNRARGATENAMFATKGNA